MVEKKNRRKGERGEKRREEKIKREEISRDKRKEKTGGVGKRRREGKKVLG